MNRQELKHIKSITLLIKAESLDQRLRVDKRIPNASEARMYGSIVEELERRGQYKVSPTYRTRYETHYKPYVPIGDDR